MRGKVDRGVLTVLREGVLKRHPGVRIPLPEDPRDTLSRSAKLATLERVAEAVGERAILEAGAVLPDLGADSPFVCVFLNSDSARVVLEKLERWARFVHSRHRERAVSLAADSLVLDHVSAAPEPPSRLETLFSCGLVIALLREVGYEGLRLSFPRSQQPQRVVYDAGRYSDPPPGDLTRRRFTWTGLTPTRRPIPGLDAQLTRGAEPLEDSPPTTREVELLVLADPSRRWRLSDVAKTLGRSGRSLQRDLADEGQTFSGVVEHVRLDLACRHLEIEGRSVTDVAYLCGFSDSAHLARRFRARFKVSPTEWRGA